MRPLVLAACFTPIAAIYVMMKVAVWMSAVSQESSYVRKEPFRRRGPYMENPYADVDAEEEEYGSRTDYR